MRGFLGGILSGGLVSTLALGTASLVAEQPAGTQPPGAPQVTAPQPANGSAPATPVTQDTTAADTTPAVARDDMPADAVPPEGAVADAAASGPSTPVGSMSIAAPQTPELPMESTALTATPEPQADTGMALQEPQSRTGANGLADTDPLARPLVSTVEGAMDAPTPTEQANLSTAPDAPVFPAPQAAAPQTPTAEANLTVSTTPAAPVVVEEPEPNTPSETGTADEVEVFVVDLGADAAAPPAETDVETDAETDAADMGADQGVTDATPEARGEDAILAGVQTTAPRLALQGDGSVLPGGGDTGVVIRRPGAADTDDATPSQADPAGGADMAGSDGTVNALVDFAEPVTVDEGKPLISIVLLDDGAMPGAEAALAGLPFPVTIALDPARDDAAERLALYRGSGFEVAALARLPEGATPQDVEVSLQAVFQTLPEGIAVLDLGMGGFQTDRAVTRQAMDILASQGRGFLGLAQGLNMAARTAGDAGVPWAEIYRELDDDGQDARVIRRFVDQAAFRARQGEDVVLVGRIRPDTLSALILWGTANLDDSVALVPASMILNKP